MNHNRIVTGVLTALTVFALGVFTLSVSSCKHGETEISVTGVTVSQPTITLGEGETAVISYTVEPSNATIKDVTFTSSNPSVVTVDENGVVTAVGPGTAVITITTKDGSFTATVTVTVIKPVAVTGVSLDKSELTLKTGDTATLTATVSPDDATDKSVIWITSDPAVAAVDKGKVTAGNIGSATITVKTNDGGKTATCLVTVKPDGVAVTGVSLNKSTLSLVVGGSETLVATVSPSDATDKSVTWSSDKTSVATVDANGKVEAKAVGEANITVTTKDGGKTASCKVTVTAAEVKVTSVSLDKTSLTLTEGEDATLIATVKPDDATNKAVTWASDKTTIATVDDNGKVTAVKAGTAKITVTTKDGGKTATCTVTVKASSVAVTGVSLDKTTLTLTEGEDATLVATVAPSTASNKQVTWSSDKESVAKVDENGKVTAVKAGTAKITVTTKDGGKTATCTVTVKAATVAVTGVSLDKTTLSMTVGEKVTLKATVAPSTASNKQVTWASDKESVATVSTSGEVEAKAAGTAVITVTTKDGGKTAKCTVTVKEATVSVTGVTLDKTTLDMQVGDKVILTATVKPDNATNKEVTWSSSATSIATVSSEGQVEAKAKGSATITVKTKDGGKTATCKVTVTEPTVELRTQFLEDKTTVATFGNVIHYKYGTNYRGTANEILVVPWDYKANNYVQDNNASHFSCKSSNTDNVSVKVEDLGSRRAFCVKVLKNPTIIKESFSDLTFTYTTAGGTNITKTVRIVVANSSFASAFSYKVTAYYKASGSYPDISSGSFSHTKKKASESSDDIYLRLYAAFDGSSSYPVADTKDMASISFSSSNTSVVSITEGSQTAEFASYPYGDLIFKSIGTSNVNFKYIDYKGSKLEKTIKVTVKKSYFDTGDYYLKDNSSSNRKYFPTTSGDNLVLYNSSGVSYKSSEIDGFTVTTSDASIATASFTTPYLTVLPKKAGNVTITVKGTDGSSRTLYYTMYKPVSSITANSTTFLLGKGNKHKMVPGKDFTISPSDATYTTVSDFNWTDPDNLGYIEIDKENGIVTGKKAGYGTVFACPKLDKNNNYVKARQFKVVDQFVEVRSGCVTMPNKSRYADNAVVYLPKGKSVTLGFSDSSGNMLAVQGAGTWSSSYGGYGVKVTNTDATDSGYITVEGTISGQNPNVYVTNSGDNGYLQRVLSVHVIEPTTFPSGAYISTSSTYKANSSSAPRNLAIGVTDSQLSLYNSSGSQLTGTSYQAISWTSSDESIATVNPSTGSLTKVTAKKAGNVTITATDCNGNKLHFYYSVYQAVSSITGSSTPFTVGYNSQGGPVKYTLKSNDLTYSPSTATYHGWADFKYSSSNTSFASVTASSSSVVVTIDPTINASSVTISAVPIYNGLGLGYTVIKTIKCVGWSVQCIKSTCTSSSAMKEGAETSNGKITIDKGKELYVQIHNMATGTNLTESYYSITGSSSYFDLVRFSFGGTTGSCIRITAKSSTGTGSFTINYSGDGKNFFQNTMQVTVI